MSKEVLNEREFELINIIGQKLGSNQRVLSRHLELSLGQTNMLIKRLIAKGFIRITQLNKRKVLYLLTPKGISEKLKQSVKYTRHTINAFSLIKDHIKEILQKEYAKGHRNFYVYSEADLESLINSAFREAKLEDCTLTILYDIPQEELDGVLLIGKENVDTGDFNLENRIDLITEVAKQNNFVSMKANPSTSPL